MPTTARASWSRRRPFIPKGLPGLAYWYGLHPFHAWIFGGLVKAMARRTEGMETAEAGERRP